MMQKYCCDWPLYQPIWGVFGPQACMASRKPSALAKNQENTEEIPKK
jgi:hypothetical protein